MYQTKIKSYLFLKEAHCCFGGEIQASFNFTNIINIYNINENSDIHFLHEWIIKLFPEHYLKLERWQGPPHTNKVKQYEVVLSFKVSLFIHSGKQRELVYSVCVAEQTKRQWKTMTYIHRGGEIKWWDSGELRKREELESETRHARTELQTKTGENKTNKSNMTDGCSQLLATK